MNELLTKSDSLTNTNLDNLELQIKQEQGEYKKGLPQSFIQLASEFVEMCFMLPKSKRENFITREKLKLNLYKLIRSQKKFKTPENIFGEIRYLAVYDKETNEIGKLLSLDIVNQTAEYITYYDRLNDHESRNKHWRDIYLFDYNSPQLESMYHHYHREHQRELTFVEMAHFLEMQNFVKEKNSVPHEETFGIELIKAEEHPIMKDIIVEYKIPINSVKHNKKKLLKIEQLTLELLEEFESVKEASDKLSISASTISNVLCQGGSAMQYKEAGGFKWQYSDKVNAKYIGNLSELITTTSKVVEKGETEEKVEGAALMKSISELISAMNSTYDYSVQGYEAEVKLLETFKAKNADIIKSVNLIYKRIK